MFTQKLFKNGNSVVVTIPREYLREFNLRDGTVVVVDNKKEGILITSKKKKTESSVDPKFAKSVNEFMNEHEDVLKELAKK